jgi:hypothetical protein
MEIKNIGDKIFGNTSGSDVYLEWDIKSVETLPTDFSDL